MTKMTSKARNDIVGVRAMGVEVRFQEGDFLVRFLFFFSGGDFKGGG